MFARAQRLSSRAAEFTARRGRVVSGLGLRIKWIPGREGASKATVVVPLSFDKRATKRNRIKRQLREVLRPILHQLPLATNLMIYVGKGASGRKFQELRNELTELLKRARLR